MQEDNIIIVVSDTGKGLDEEYRNNPSVIFNAFESSRCNKNGEKIGTGLGLYITKATVNEYKNSSISMYADSNQVVNKKESVSNVHCCYDNYYYVKTNTLY